jgi:hypothetical protein
LCLLAALVSVGGCGQKSDRVSVDGQITYRGAPVPKAAVTFFPNNGRPVTAPVSDQGQYQIELLPGDYVATVNLSTELPPGFKEGDPIPPPKIVLPPVYTTRAKSPLKATVSASQSEPIDFALE